MTCVLCNKSVGELYQESLVGENRIVCHQCLSSSSDIHDHEEFIISAFSMFTKPNLNEIASSQLLKLIYSGKLYSYRHNLFKSGGNDKNQSHNLFNALVVAFNNLKDKDYVFKVLIPETVIYLFAKVKQISRIKAEVILSAYISKRNKDRICSSPESNSGSELHLSETKKSNKVDIDLEDDLIVKQVVEELVLEVINTNKTDFSVFKSEDIDSGDDTSDYYDFEINKSFEVKTTNCSLESISYTDYSPECSVNKSSEVNNSGNDNHEYSLNKKKDQVVNGANKRQ
ncbi:uncharacterized protein LOC136094528 [Hydra vulgaris]|uniref:uncharacterized protein LOC136094528 n=1 Tax=Hydra vulgaris TaxID=6087 RepID=UPI0032EA388E